MLGRDAITREDRSYVLHVEPDRIDACRFERLARQAAEVIDANPDRARELCRRALDLWRGPPFGDLSDEEFVLPEAHRLEELRAMAIELHFEADLALGRHAEIVGGLQAAVRDHPYSERLWFMLMQALARQGRRAEALRACQELRSMLGELGLEPTHEIVDLEQQILLEDPRVRPHFNTGPAA